MPNQMGHCEKHDFTWNKDFYGTACPKCGEEQWSDKK